MDIAGGAKDGGKVGKWAGLALGVCCGLLATAVIFASAGLALPGVAIHALHSTALLTLSQAAGISAIAMAACSAAGAVGGWLNGKIIGGLTGIFRQKQPDDTPLSPPKQRGKALNARNTGYELPEPLPMPDHTPRPLRQVAKTRGVASLGI